ncbi:unnamed protein product [Cuscuta campestris]|uniref:Uncharacterized protein n=1 Tax=Cuscuta campestris TaxID=132261 RepID=A0A484N2Z3_9ASTE|nr:unnamed protein product [Cuscuta campestris]
MDEIVDPNAWELSVLFGGKREIVVSPQISVECHISHQLTCAWPAWTLMLRVLLMDLKPQISFIVLMSTLIRTY